MRSDPEEYLAREPREGERTHGAEDDAIRQHLNHVLQHETDHVQAARAQCHAHANLARSSCHAKRKDSEDAYARDSESKETEQAAKCCQRPFNWNRPVD